MGSKAKLIEQQYTAPEVGGDGEDCHWGVSKSKSFYVLVDLINPPGKGCGALSRVRILLRVVSF